MTEICHNPATDIVHVIIRGEFNSSDVVSLRQALRRSLLSGKRALFDLTHSTGMFSITWRAAK